MARNLVLLGDSIFDNGVYVGAGESDVATHLERKVDPTDWTIDMRAVDGAVVHDVESQLTGDPVALPATFVLSVGGNDALRHLDLVQDPAADKAIASMLLTFHKIKEEFRGRYKSILEKILAYRQPVIVCTIYNPKFQDPDLQMVAEAGLSFFNDVIVEEALRRSLPIIDLRCVCSDAAAFANPIEPSELGGDYITDAIVQLLSA